MDVICFLVAVTAVPAVLAAVYVPSVAEWLASVLIARAEAVKAARRAYTLVRKCELRLEPREVGE